MNRLNTRVRSTLIRVFALIVAGMAALALNLPIVRHVNLAIFSGVVSAAVMPVFLLNRWSDARSPDEEALSDAVSRIRSSYRSFLDFYGTEKPEINPPVALRLVGKNRQALSLEAFAATAEIVANQLFIAKFAESENRCTVVLGEAGSGKSTLLLRLAAYMAEDYKSQGVSAVPLVLALRDWSDDYSFRRWVLEKTVSTYAVPRPIVNCWLDRGRAVLILDGLDQVKASRRSRLIEVINTWVNRPGGMRVVVSCRSSLEHIEDMFSLLDVDQLALLRPVPETQAKKYVDVALSNFWHQSVGRNSRDIDHAIRVFKDAITNNASLCGPSMLSLVRATAVERGKTGIAKGDPANDVLSLAMPF